jgi:hypothetical protein
MPLACLLLGIALFALLYGLVAAVARTETPE